MSRAPSFLGMNKTEQLSLLGDMYDILRRVGPRKVQLDEILSRTSLRSCGSVGCVVGWAATDRSIADRLQVRLGGYNMKERKFDKSVEYSTSLMLTRLNPEFKDLDVHPIRPQLSCLQVFKEERINAFLFSSLDKIEKRLGHYRAALSRLVYIGRLIDLNIPMHDWSRECNSTIADKFINDHRRQMVSEPFVREHMDKVVGLPRLTAVTQNAQ